MLTAIVSGLGLVLNAPVVEVRQVAIASPRLAVGAQIFPSLTVAGLIDDEAEAYAAKTAAIRAKVR